MAEGLRQPDQRPLLDSLQFVALGHIGDESEHHPDFALLRLGEFGMRGAGDETVGQALDVPAYGLGQFVRIAALGFRPGILIRVHVSGPCASDDRRRSIRGLLAADSEAAGRSQECID